MNKIYRIEDADGKGVYASGKNWIGKSESNRGFPDRHPVPSRDLKLKMENPDLFCRDGYYFIGLEFIFGFSSVEQLKKWFLDESWLLSLHINGFVLAIYSGEVRIGDTQAVIKKETACLVEKISILDFLKTEYKKDYSKDYENLSNYGGTKQKRVDTVPLLE